MPYIIRTPQFNSRRTSSVVSDRPIAARIVDRLSPVVRELLAACLILATSFVPSVSAYKLGGPLGPTTTVQGSSGRKTVIDVRTSPAIYLPGPTFWIEVISLKPITSQVPEFLRRLVEQNLLKNDPRLRVAPVSADTSLSCAITDFSVSPGVETRTRPECQKTGEVTVTDPSTGTSHTEDQYAYVNVPYQTLVFEGRMGLRFEVIDVATGILLYATRFDSVYSDAREAAAGFTAPSVDGLNSIYLALAENIAGLILAQVCPRNYSEIVILAAGKLKDASKLLESGYWSEALTLLSSMPAFKKPKDDSYRFYSIGVAYEALAYKALGPIEKKRQMALAVYNYGRAAELKPGENMFWAPKNRAELMLLQTGGLVAQVEAYEEAKKPGSTTGVSPGRVASGSRDLFGQIRNQTQSSPPVITNHTVVEWVKAGRSVDYIVASLRHAGGTQFDLSEAEVFKLRRDGVNNSVLKAMSEAQGRRYGNGGRSRGVFLALSLLWWVPFVFAR